MRERIKKAGVAPWLSVAVLIWVVAVATPRARAAAAAQTVAPVKKSAMVLEIAQGSQPSPAAPATPAESAAPAPPGTYAPTGAKACLDCHDNPTVTGIAQTPHGVSADGRTPYGQHQCETCHGASPEHIADPTTPPTVVFGGSHPSPAAERSAVCLRCHESGLRTHWAGSQHEVRGVTCSDCHNVHARDEKVLTKATQAQVCFVCHKDQRAQVRRISSHPLATTSLASAPKMVCADCHNPHGSDGPKLLIKSSVNETCYMCHADKRGPFLWEHAPVVDDCTNCHTPHGSVNASLLKTRPPLLCQECHTGDHASQINSGANLAGGNVTTVNGAQLPGAASPRIQVAGRACLNCHVLIHGSNDPAGAKFQR